MENIHKLFTSFFSSEKERRLIFEEVPGAQPEAVPPTEKGAEAQAGAPLENDDAVVPATESKVAEAEGLIANGQSDLDAVAALEGAGAGSIEGVAEAQESAESVPKTKGDKLFKDIDNGMDSLKKAEGPAEVLKAIIKIFMAIKQILSAITDGSMDTPLDKNGNIPGKKPETAEKTNSAETEVANEVKDKTEPKEKSEALGEIAEDAQETIEDNTEQISEIKDRVEDLRGQRKDINSKIGEVEDKITAAKLEGGKTESLELQLKKLEKQDKAIDEEITDQLNLKTKLEKQNNRLTERKEAASSLKENVDRTLETLTTLEKSLEKILQAKVKIESDDGKLTLIVEDVSADAPKWVVTMLTKLGSGEREGEGIYELDVSEGEFLEQAPEDLLKPDVEEPSKKPEDKKEAPDADVDVANEELSNLVNNLHSLAVEDMVTPEEIDNAIMEINELLIGEGKSSEEIQTWFTEEFEDGAVGQFEVGIVDDLLVRIEDKAQDATKEPDEKPADKAPEQNEPLEDKVTAIENKFNQLVETASNSDFPDVDAGKLLGELNALVSDIGDTSIEGVRDRITGLGAEFTDGSSIRFDYGGTNQFVLETPAPEQAPTKEPTKEPEPEQKKEQPAEIVKEVEKNYKEWAEGIRNNANSATNAYNVNTEVNPDGTITISPKEAEAQPEGWREKIEQHALAHGIETSRGPNDEVVAVVDRFKNGVYLGKEGNGLAIDQSVQDRFDGKESAVAEVDDSFIDGIPLESEKPIT